MIVLDASAFMAAFAVDPQPSPVRTRIGQAMIAHAPHLIDLEVLSALRRAVRRREVAEERAANVREAMMDLRLVRHPHRALAERIWDLRQNLTPYDASYVALSEALDLPLVTCDGRLARSKGHGAEIELYP